MDENRVLFIALSIGICQNPLEYAIRCASGMSDDDINFSIKEMLKKVKGMIVKSETEGLIRENIAREPGEKDFKEELWDEHGKTSGGGKRIVKKGSEMS